MRGRLIEGGDGLDPAAIVARNLEDVVNHLHHAQALIEVGGGSSKYAPDEGLYVKRL